MALPELYQQIELLQNSLKQTAQLTARLVKTQSNLTTMFHDTAYSDAETGDTYASLSAEIHETLKQEEEDLELLQQDVEDLGVVANKGLGSTRRESLNTRVSETERAHGILNATCNRLAEELKMARTRFRRAQLQAKKNAEFVQQKEQLAYLAGLKAASNSSLSDDDSGGAQAQTHSEMRNSLLNPSRRGGRFSNNNTKEDVLLAASADLTSSLRRTHDLLTSEVSRSHFAHDALVASNSALEELNKRYGTLDNLLSRSRGLLSSLLRSQKSDTWYLETAFHLLLGTVAWLLFRRLLYGPTWWLVWQPLKLLWNVIAGFLGLLIGQRGISSGQTSRAIEEMMPRATSSPSKFSAESDTEAARRTDYHEVKTPTVYNNGDEQNTWEGLNQIVGTIVDNTQTGRVNVVASSAADPAADEKQENTESDGDKDDSVSEEIMDQQREEKAGEGKVHRGDGTVLRDRNSIKEPPNPKKRMWEEPPREVRNKDEL